MDFSPAHTTVDTVKPMPSNVIATIGTNTGDGMRLTSRALAVQVMAASKAHANVAPGAKVHTEEYPIMLGHEAAG